MPDRPTTKKRTGKPSKPDAEEGVTEDKLKRERAGTYRTGDGRFTVEQSSSGWLLLDDQQTDELGLPLARGPFATLDEARSAVAAARSGPRPMSSLADRQSARENRPSRSAVRPDRPSRRSGPGSTSPRPGRSAATSDAPKRPPLKALRAPGARAPTRPAVVIRDIRTVDGDGLRELWRDVGFHSIGDDDRSLARLARRNPGLVLVAAEGSRIVGSALGGWDGRRGWMYHVATAQTHRRQGIAARLVERIEAGLGDLGCPKISVMVSEENAGGRAFWSARGYSMAPTRQLSRELKVE